MADNEIKQEIKRLIAKSGPPLSGKLSSKLLRLVDKLIEIQSDPPPGGKEVTNVYIEMVDGNPKLRVEYED